MDILTLTDEELNNHHLLVLAEINRRNILATAQAQTQAIAEKYRHAAGLIDGTPWVQPTGAHDAVPPGGIRIFEGHLWENTSGQFLSHSPAEYPQGWTDRGEPGEPDPEPGGHPEGYVGPWDADATYSTGNIVDKDGSYWYCVYPHGPEQQGQWAPGVAHTVWTNVGPVN